MKRLVLFLLLALMPSLAIAQTTQATVLASYAVSSNGVIMFQFYKEQLTGGVVTSEQDHILAVSPGDNLTYDISASNAILSSLGFPSISGTDTATMQSLVASIQTPAVISAYQASLR